jgi:ketosteroid isomerase-like protein
MSAQENEALRLGKSYIAALTRGDPEGVIALLHDHIVIEEANPLVKDENQPGSKTCSGDAVRSLMREMPKYLSRVKFDNGIWRTTNDGLAVFEAAGDMALGDGRPYRNKYLMIFEASAGKLIRVKEYINPVIWARANGVPLDSIP